MANPVNRKEAILAGDNVNPVTREEYFVKEAVSNGGGGSSLPSVTSADNMKALAVVNGQWAVGDAGYKVTTTQAVAIPEQTIVTAVDGKVAPFGEIVDYNFDYAPDTMTVVFNGTSYTVPRIEPPFATNTIGEYGDYELSEYPFCLLINITDGMYFLFTATAGSYTLSATAPVESLTVSDTFKQARGYSVDNGAVTASEEFTEAVLSAQLKPVVAFVENKIGDATKKQIKVTGEMINQPLTWEEISTAYEAGLFSVKEYFVQKVYENSGSYRVVLISFSGGSAVENLFGTSSADGYPEMGGK